MKKINLALVALLAFGASAVMHAKMLIIKNKTKMPIWIRGAGEYSWDRTKWRKIGKGASKNLKIKEEYFEVGDETGTKKTTISLFPGAKKYVIYKSDKEGKHFKAKGLRAGKEVGWRE